jgi:hypothetical protein
MWAQTAPGATPYTVELWLKADQVQTTLPADNASVYTWKDRSSKGLDFVQRGSSDVPTFKKVSDFNYQPSLVWVSNRGYDRYLTLISQSNFVPSANRSYYVFAVSKVEDGERYYAQTIIQLQPVDNVINGWFSGGTVLAWTGSNMSNSGDNAYSNTYRAVTTTLNGTAHATGNAGAGFDTQTGDKKYGLISWIIPNNGNASSGDIAAIYLNGHRSDFWNGSAAGSGWQDRRGRGASWQTGAANKIQLGQGGTGNWFPFQGEIMEVIILSQDNNVAIDAVKLHQMETYLALKYGLTLNLSSSDPAKFDKYVNSDNQAVWSYDPDFNQKIFGIGRDDASGLYQKQSKSSDVSMFTAFVGNAVADINVNNTTGTLENKQYVVFGAKVGSIVDYSYSDGTAFANGAITAPKGLNFRKNEIYKAMATKSGVVGAATVKLKVPAGTQFVLVSKTTAFTPADTRFYDAQSGVVTVALDQDFKYIDFAGNREAAPGATPYNVELWLKADQVQNTLPQDNTDVTTWLDCSGKNLNFSKKATKHLSPKFKKVSDFNF